MRRSDLLKIAGLTTATFNNLAARDLLPFAPKTRSEPTWGDYTADDAFRLVLMVKLAECGWGQQAAAKVVRLHYKKLVRASGQPSQSKDRPWLFGTVWVARPTKDGVKLKRRSVIARAGEVEQVVHDQVNPPEERLSHWAVVDASEVLRQLYERAIEHGVVSARLETLVAHLGEAR